MNCLIIFKSMTYTQSALSLLGQKGVSARIVKPPMSVDTASCKYALRIRNNDRARAIAALAPLRAVIAGVFEELQGGRYCEVAV